MKNNKNAKYGLLTEKEYKFIICELLDKNKECCFYINKRIE